ncbi:RagB/SusD family nutrient uptake outer membrane protein [Halosquirtibacter laminarini]|uniref:RagB/SusD family nutrient uptake outer membrane protein n=1 Tax=Halosquirtibacter laminarini TaxID=3374600 RepID=A0AC61NJZ9_9BACT|nr:RagB/SusD family nutrient uptake outer membrane protein [Prolixibacteraceae bacterium]
MQRLSKYIVVVAIFIATTMLQSCTDFLNKDPYSDIKLENFYKDEKQAELALTGIYSSIGSDYTYGYYLSCRFTSGTDDMIFSRNYSTWNVSLFTANDATNELEQSYRALFQGINLANIFIEKVSVSNIDETKKQRFLAEARFLRAFYYFDLVRWFGDVPLRLESVTSSATSETTKPKSDVLDVYQKAIIPDLVYASEHALSKGDSDYQIGRVTKAAANGILQRVYLAIAGVKNDEKRGAYEEFTKEKCYQNVIKYGKLIVDSRQYNLIDEYKQIFLNEIQSIASDEEVIFEAQFKNLRQGGIEEHGRIGNMNGVQVFMSGLTDPYAYAYNYAALSLLYDYDKSTGDRNEDKRYIWNVAPFKVALNNKLDTIYAMNPDTNQPELDADGDKVIEKVIYTTDRVAGFTYVGNFTTRNPGKFRRVSFTELEDGVLRMERKKVEMPSGQQKTLYLCYKQMPAETYKTGDDGTGHMYLLNDDGSKTRLSKHQYLVTEGFVWKQIPNGSLQMKTLESGAIDKNFTSINFPLLRYADVLLMMAEANIQLGQLSDAIPFVNKVRERAGVPDLDAYVTGDQTLFFKELVDERNRELCFEGIRRHDLVRWGIYGDKLKELNDLMIAEPINKNSKWMLRHGENYKKELEILPTPLSEMNINLGMKEE